MVTASSVSERMVFIVVAHHAERVAEHRIHHAVHSAHRAKLGPEKNLNRTCDEVWPTASNSQRRFDKLFRLTYEKMGSSSMSPNSDPNNDMLMTSCNFSFFLSSRNELDRNDVHNCREFSNT